MLFLPRKLAKVPAQSEFPQFSFLCNLPSPTSDISLSLFFNYDRRGISGNRNVAIRENLAQSRHV